ncbi:unnamed protein product, partial [Allacma fusca]
IVSKVKDQVGPVYEDYKAINDAKLKYKAPAIGIDLGTTYCCVAVYQNEEVDVIPNSIGENTTPSYVVFDEDEIIVGKTAKDKAYLKPQDTMYDVKRMCGRHFDEEKIQRLRKYWPFTIVKSDDGKIKIKVQNKYLLPEQVIKEILIHLKHTADKYLGEPVINAVVTVPAYFSPSQRALTKDACYKAGLNVLQFISEPAAAAVAYGLDPQHKIDKRSCLIFDLGGGTFDVAVLELHRNEIIIKAIDGDPYLGGEDFDNAMIDYCVEAFKREHGIDLTTVGTKFERDKRFKRIKTQCELQKVYLSAARQVKVSIDAIHGGIPLLVPLTRDIFSELIKPSVDNCMKVVDQILSKCEMKETDIHEVMVVGGSSRIPYVQSRLSEKFGGRPLLKRVVPEEAVAHGAAILAFNIEHPDAGLPNVFIQDSNFQSLLDIR